MSREINPTQPYQDKLVKLIPTEIVGAYLVLSGIIPKQPENALGGLGLVVFLVLLALTPLYLWRISKVTHALQLIVSTISFGVWVNTINPIISIISKNSIPAIILILWTLIIPLFVTPKTE
jgi:hypothetical protein